MKLNVGSSIDGVQRATIRVEFRVGLRDLGRAAVYALEFETCETAAEHVPTEALKRLTRADVLAAAHGMHHEFGMVGVDSAAGVNRPDGVTLDEGIARARDLFPEFGDHHA